MGHNFDPFLCEEIDLGSPLLNHKFLKFIKLTEIISVQVFGFVKDEHIFNIVAFMKTKLWNYLTHT
jgi:hypothetical protein